MKFEERYSLKNIVVGKFDLVQASTSLWHTGKVTQNPILFIVWNDEKKTWSGCVENGKDYLEFRSADLQVVISTMEKLLTVYCPDLEF